MSINYSDTHHALANEARRQELRQKIAALRGGLDATSSVMQRLASINNDQLLEMKRLNETLSAFEAGSAPGATDDFGSKSNTTQLLENERTAANAAVISLCKKEASCTEADAVKCWEEAAIKSHEGFDLVLHDAVSLMNMYRVNLMAAGLISEDTWEAHRDWMASSTA